MKKVCSYIFTLFVSLLMLQACGGGGSAAVVPLTQKKVIVELSTLTSNTNANALTEGVTIVFSLPEGVVVATDGPGSTKIINLDGVNSFSILFPTYANNKVTIDATNVTNTNANVVFARLTCDVKPGYTLSAEQFSKIAPSVFDPRGRDGMDLTDPTIVNPPVSYKISATFEY
jgi:hypothetical protein